MAERRSGRMVSVPSPLSLLDELEPARRALTRTMARVHVGGPVYLMLEAAVVALDGVATVLGHAGRFHGRAP